MLQCVAVCCNVMQCDAECCALMQSVARTAWCVNIMKPRLIKCCMISISIGLGLLFSALQCVAVCCSVLQCVAVCCSVLQCVTVCYSVLQCVAVLL